MSDQHSRGGRKHPQATEAPSDELLLAAIERACRHDARPNPAVPVWTILEHLDIRKRTAGALHVGERLQMLHAAGLLEGSRRHGVATWALTSAGRGRLQRARAATGALAPLPESPQHRTWRAARTAAQQEIERFREQLRAHVERAMRLLDSSAVPHSDVWLELGEQLQRGCQRVASASHCLYEWHEPDDLRADIDQRVEPTDSTLDCHTRGRLRARRAGRRNFRLWKE
jgi:hypothetical protein